MNPFPIAIPLAYLSGSIPFGMLIARMHHINIREHGSGNIGATNVWRTLGTRAGLTCFVLDVLKGFLPVFFTGLATGLLHTTPIPATDAWLWLAVAAAAILGHMYPIWLGFKGGKGVATGFGTLLGLYPVLTWPAIGALLIWIVLAKTTRYVSLASCCAAVSLPLWLALSLVLMRQTDTNAIDALTDTTSLPWLLTMSLLAIFILIRHRSNIGRLIAGTENKIGQKKT